MITIHNYNREIQESKIGVPRETGGFVIENGQVVPETMIDKKSFDDIVFEVQGCDRFTHTSISELNSSNSSLLEQIQIHPEKQEELQALIDENNYIIGLILLEE